MRTFMLRRDPAAEDALLSEAPEATCVILTILDRLNSCVQSIPMGGEMAIHFGWTEEMAISALMLEAPMDRKDAENILGALGYSTLVEEQNDTEVAELFAV